MQLSIQEVFINYMSKLREFNQNLETPIYGLSLLKNLKKHQCFDVPDIDSKITKQITHIIGNNKIYCKFTNFNSLLFPESYA